MADCDRTRRYFEREFSDFNASYGNPAELTDVVRRLSCRFNRRAIEGRLNALIELAGDVDGRSVLEVGCGPGLYSIKLAEKRANVTAIDYSKGMLDAATRNAEKAGVEVDFRLSDFLRDDVTGSFDCVFATGVIEYIEPASQPAFLKKMAGLSRRAVIVSFPKKYVVHALIRKLWLSLFKGVKVSFFTEGEISQMAAACGLKESDRQDVGILWVIRFEVVG